jgi:hypothetical protein
VAVIGKGTNVGCFGSDSKGFPSQFFCCHIVKTNLPVYAALAVNTK